MARYPSSTEWDRSRVIPVRLAPRLRHRHQAMNTTMGHPTPMSSRLDPVMLASAREHGDSPVEPGGLQATPYWAKASPPLRANTRSTAYSGRTAMNARTAMARPAEMSSWAASAAHDSRKAAPTMAAP